ncbi:MAG: hypothetical protein AMXMBFR59_22560 [Rhodanobacteraceae bacterium]
MEVRNAGYAARWIRRADAAGGVLSVFPGAGGRGPGYLVLSLTRKLTIRRFKRASAGYNGFEAVCFGGFGLIVLAKVQQVSRVPVEFGSRAGEKSCVEMAYIEAGSAAPLRIVAHRFP